MIRVRIKTSQEQENQGRLQVINNTVEGSSHSPKAVGSPRQTKGWNFMKKQLMRNRLLKMTIAFAMMISAICLSGCGRQQTETKQKVVHVAEYGNDETGTGA